MSDGGLAAGALLVVLGVFVVARTVVHDDQGQNLVDRLLAIAGGGGKGGKDGKGGKGSGVPGPAVHIHNIGGVPVPFVVVPGISPVDPFDLNPLDIPAEVLP